MNFVVLGPGNQTGGFIFEPHSVEVEHQFVRCYNPPRDIFIFRHGLDLVFLERLRSIVYPILSDWEPITGKGSRGAKLYPRNPAETQLHSQPLNVAVFGLEQ